MPECVEPIRISDDAREDALVVSEQDESELASDSYRSAQGETPAKPAEMGCLNHADLSIKRLQQ